MEITHPEEHPKEETLLDSERLQEEAERVAENIKAAYDEIILPFKEGAPCEGEFFHLKRVDGKWSKESLTPMCRRKK